MINNRVFFFFFVEDDFCEHPENEKKKNDKKKPLYIYVVTHMPFWRDVCTVDIFNAAPEQARAFCAQDRTRRINNNNSYRATVPKLLRPRYP